MEREKRAAEDKRCTEMKDKAHDGVWSLDEMQVKGKLCSIIQRKYQRKSRIIQLRKKQKQQLQEPECLWMIFFIYLRSQTDFPVL